MNHRQIDVTATSSWLEERIQEEQSLGCGKQRETFVMVDGANEPVVSPVSVEYDGTAHDCPDIVQDRGVDYSVHGGGPDRRNGQPQHGDSHGLDRQKYGRTVEQAPVVMVQTLREEHHRSCQGVCYGLPLTLPPQHKREAEQETPGRSRTSHRVDGVGRRAEFPCFRFGRIVQAKPHLHDRSNRDLDTNAHCVGD